VKDETGLLKDQPRTGDYMGEVSFQTDNPMEVEINDIPEEFQSSHYRQNVKMRACLIDKSGAPTNVVLSPKMTTDLINISLNSSNASEKINATINGNKKDKIEVIDVRIFKEPPPIIASVQNESTGEIHNVSVQVQPTDPQNSVHGKILEIFSPIDDQKLSDISAPSYFEELSSVFSSTHDYVPPQRNQTSVLMDVSMPEEYSSKYSYPSSSRQHTTERSHRLEVPRTLNRSRNNRSMQQK
jgi:hypothetical protein